MSAYVLHKAHIDALVTAGLVLTRPYGPLRWYSEPISQSDSLPEISLKSRELHLETADEVGQLLWNQNVDSVDYLYNEAHSRVPYKFKQLRGTPDPVVILSALACYEYQSCEAPEWRNCEANSFCESLRRAAIRKVPGYDDAPWSIADPDLFIRPLVSNVRSILGGK